MEAPIKRTKFPAYFISDLAHVVAFTDERIPFTSLTSGKIGVNNYEYELLENFTAFFRKHQERTAAGVDV